MTDNRVVFAFDKASARTRDADGRMRVKDCVLSTAEVNPYRGNEIPGWQNLGLDPNRIYELYRDPEEMAASVPTFEGIPLMVKHIPQTADEPRKEYIGGSVHNVRFDGKKLRGDLLVWDGVAIDLIESEEQADLSNGYRYKPDMTPRIVNGRTVDGTMRKMEGNHTALVDDGRASGAHVADRALQDPQSLTCGDMAMTDITQPAVPATPAAPAADANPPAAPAPAAAPAAPAADPNLAAIGEGLKHIATMLQSMMAAMPKAEEAPPAAPAATDGDPTENGDPNDDATGGAQDMELDETVPNSGGLNRSDDVDPLAEPGETALPAQARQEGTTARGGDTPRVAMDAATVDKRVAAAVAAERRRHAEVEEAKRAVRGVLGDVYGMDNAGQIYREALKAQGIDTSGIARGMAKLAWQSHVNAVGQSRGVRSQADMAMDADAIGKTQKDLLAKLGGIKTLG